ncbi:MAG: bifunctional metallophosphatase/5'-nucleotidase [Actinomycetota bacterium]
MVWAFVVASGLIASGMSAGAGAQTGGTRPREVHLQLLGLNDYHGHIQDETPGSINGAPAGGAEFLATHIERLQKGRRHSLVVAAGDLIGASPLVSALFHDEPSIESLDIAGLDLASVGNHEFDEGWRELLRMQNGGCHPTDGCQDGDGFEGAGFHYLSANVIRRDTREPLLPPYEVREVGGVEVAFIGMTLEGTPEIVTASGVEGLEFRDEADTANRLVARLRKQGIESFVVLLHEGGAQPGGINDCSGISGPVVDIVQRTTDRVDAFVTGHTHRAYNCVIDGAPVTSASSFGRLVTDLRFTLDPRTGDVSAFSAENIVVTHDVPRDRQETALVEKYEALSAPLANRVIGSITADITRDSTGAGESALGDVIADAQLEATSAPDSGNAVVAFMNPGGIRADLRQDQISGGEGPGEVTYGEAFNVQPFGNSLVTMTLTGAQIERVLEQQFRSGSQVILQVSRGFTYTWDAAGPVGDRVDPSTIETDGVTVDPNASYRVTVNNFLADGGDGFSVLREGTDRVGGPVDLDALEAYFGAHSPVPPGPRARIARAN